MRPWAERPAAAGMEIGHHVVSAMNDLSGATEGGTDMVRQVDMTEPILPTSAGAMTAMLRGVTSVVAAMAKLTEAMTVATHQHPMGQHATPGLAMSQGNIVDLSELRCMGGLNLEQGLGQPALSRMPEAFEVALSHNKFCQLAQDHGSACLGSPEKRRELLDHRADLDGWMQGV